MKITCVGYAGILAAGALCCTSAPAAAPKMAATQAAIRSGAMNPFLALAAFGTANSKSRVCGLIGTAIAAETAPLSDFPATRRGRPTSPDANGPQFHTNVAAPYPAASPAANSNRDLRAVLDGLIALAILATAHWGSNEFADTRLPMSPS